MADGTIAGLRAGQMQTYWDADKRKPYGVLCYNPLAAEWRLGTLVLREDRTETTHTMVVLRTDLDNGDAIKIVVPQAEGAVTPTGQAQGIVHICPFYKGEPGMLKYRGSLHIFEGGI